jgi:hypothetical protein
LAVDVTQILSELLAHNAGPDPLDPDCRRRPDYRVSASLEGSTLDIALTFRAGAAYCCYEPGCHLLLAGRQWDALRRALAAHGISTPTGFEVRLTCIVEEGALFFDFSKPDPSRRGWYAFRPVTAYRFQVFADEGDTWR